MGADQSSASRPRANYPNAGQAFTDIVVEAQFDYGHAGYSGTFAEKHDFMLLGQYPGDDVTLSHMEEIGELEFSDEVEARPNDLNPLIRWLSNKGMLERAIRIDGDKWGPALCIGTPTEWMFTGYCSS